MAEVKLFDREAYIAYEDIGGAYVDVIRRGDWDHVAGVQAFAAHREAAEKAEREACAKVAEDCMKLISIGTPGTGPFTRDDQVVDEVTAIIATAILPDADELAEALDECQNILGQIPAPMSAPLWFSMCGAMKRARTALANYRKGTGREG